MPNTVIDIWQANATGRYDNDDPNNPPPADRFILRAKLKTNEKGEYSFTTIKPVPYQIGENQYRPAHIHLKAALELVGRPVGPPRLPLLPATPEERETLRRALEDAGLL